LSGSRLPRQSRRHDGFSLAHHSQATLLPSPNKAVSNRSPYDARGILSVVRFICDSWDVRDARNIPQHGYFAAAVIMGVGLLSNIFHNQVEDAILYSQY
jgi:hypothetical protein